ncbi:Cytochrome P450 76C1 [Cinnamomum micranthum f. kanehirae]|uniref:Cytochrome P450 76C1 n=1 Tax=Cinnamomum micranthum f. kanehirae TaxID=337451 RepID=A0A443NQB4_9MAGN|nr:Cytochrome P450 76C1 [Cinnamomum micranthum f. kanehirae]
MAELLNNPKVMVKARAELIGSIIKGKSIEESDNSGLPYLQAVVKETFCLSPPAPLLRPHKAESDLEIGGYTIPEDSKRSGFRAYPIRFKSTDLSRFTSRLSHGASDACLSSSII